MFFVWFFFQLVLLLWDKDGFVFVEDLYVLFSVDRQIYWKDSLFLWLEIEIMLFVVILYFRVVNTIFSFHVCNWHKRLHQVNLLVPGSEVLKSLKCLLVSSLSCYTADIVVRAHQSSIEYDLLVYFYFSYFTITTVCCNSGWERDANLFHRSTILISPPW